MSAKIALMRQSDEAEDAYCKALQHLGHVRCIPVLSFNFINIPKLSSLLNSPQDWGGIIFTSKRAVQAVRTSLPHEWAGKPCFVVGQATSRLASDVGFNCMGAESGCAGALAELIKQKYRDELPLLFVCGAVRRDTLPLFMDKHNISYQCQVVYQSVACPDILEEIKKFVHELGPPSHIVYFSPAGYNFAHQHWTTVLGLVENVQLVAIGNTTWTEMGEDERVLAAKKPNPSSLCDVIS